MTVSAMPVMVLKLVFALAPVLALLGILIYLDSYKLVRLQSVLWTILAGALAATLCYLVNRNLLVRLPFSIVTYSRYVAPFVEESLKALVILWLIRTDRVGFLVDAAIYGFALGAGFALLENVYYLGALSGDSLVVWILRGFGTALMHGGTTAIFGVAGKSLHERDDLPPGVAYLPGFTIAVAIHSAFNHFFFSPVISTLFVMVAVPLLLLVVFQRGERSVESWLRVGFDADTELLELIREGRLSDTKVGQYLQTLKEHFPSAVLLDMLCYLQIRVELSLRAKALLIMRESGFSVPMDDDDRARLAELTFLEASIGRAGRLALAPFVRMKGKDLWQISMLS